MKEIQISSPAFKSGDWIPDRHSGFGDDISPELHIDGIDVFVNPKLYHNLIEN